MEGVIDIFTQRLQNMDNRLMIISATWRQNMFGSKATKLIIEVKKIKGSRF